MKYQIPREFIGYVLAIIFLAIFLYIILMILLNKKPFKEWVKWDYKRINEKPICFRDWGKK